MLKSPLDPPLQMGKFLNPPFLKELLTKTVYKEYLLAGFTVPQQQRSKRLMTDRLSDKAKVFLVDDHPAVRQGLSLLFSQTGHTICGEAESIAETLKKLEQVVPDIVLVDISLDQESGFDLLAELKQRNLKSIVYSMHGDAGSIEKAFKLGANGYVTKRDATTALLEAIEAVLAGQRHVSSKVAQSLATRLIDGSSSQQQEQQLSDRELEIVEQMRRGYSTADIAQELIISPRTVESYYARIIEN